MLARGWLKLRRRQEQSLKTNYIVDFPGYQQRFIDTRGHLALCDNPKGNTTELVHPRRGLWVTTQLFKILRVLAWYGCSNLTFTAILTVFRDALGHSDSVLISAKETEHILASGD